ncbi:MAG: hypothetical protein METHAR1v1_470007 [Methanothrix sp.]|nr:MAG: hypothetical protein METHAR1v1_470007 [Methanothrix sp.]
MGYASGPHARFSGFQKSLILCCPDSLICRIETLLWFPLNGHQCFIGLKEHEKQARVHFIPDLKVGVFVTLRTPEVIKRQRCYSAICIQCK